MDHQPDKKSSPVEIRRHGDSFRWNRHRPDEDWMFFERVLFRQRNGFAVGSHLSAFESRSSAPDIRKFSWEFRGPRGPSHPDL